MPPPPTYKTHPKFIPACTHLMRKYAAYWRVGVRWGAVLFAKIFGGKCLRVFMFLHSTLFLWRELEKSKREK